MSVVLKGVDLVSGRLKALARNVPTEVGQAMFAEAEIEMAEAKNRTPVDTGALRASGHVDGPRVDGSGIEVRLAFNTDYAVYVHENLEAFHEIGQAKFLESVLVENAPYLADRIATRVDVAKAAR